VLGILSAQITNWLIAKPVVEGENILFSWNGQMGWRWMFWAETIPALLFFPGWYFSYRESPRWLASKLKYDKAYDIFAKNKRFGICKNPTLKKIKETLSLTPDNISFKHLFRGKLAKIVLIRYFDSPYCNNGAGINVDFQLCSGNIFRCRI